MDAHTRAFAGGDRPDPDPDPSRPSPGDPTTPRIGTPGPESRRDLSVSRSTRPVPATEGVVGHHPRRDPGHPVGHDGRGGCPNVGNQRPCLAGCGARRDAKGLGAKGVIICPGVKGGTFRVPPPLHPGIHISVQVRPVGNRVPLYGVCGLWRVRVWVA